MSSFNSTGDTLMLAPVNIKTAIYEQDHAVYSRTAAEFYSYGL